MRCCHWHRMAPPRSCPHRLSHGPGARPDRLSASPQRSVITQLQLESDRAGRLRPRLRRPAVGRAGIEAGDPQAVPCRAQSREARRHVSIPRHAPHVRDGDGWRWRAAADVAGADGHRDIQTTMRSSDYPPSARGRVHRRRVAQPCYQSCSNLSESEPTLMTSRQRLRAPSAGALPGRVDSSGREFCGAPWHRPRFDEPPSV